MVRSELLGRLDDEAASSATNAVAASAKGAEGDRRCYYGRDADLTQPDWHLR
jgi:hypothetical protein